MDITASIAERFWAKVDIKGAEECWPWLAAKVPLGYGRFGITPKWVVPSHRLAYCLANNVTMESIKGLDTLHSCDNPPCNNPKHLSIDTHLENMKEASQRDLFPRGENHPGSKLTDQNVREIRQLFLQNGMSDIIVGAMFGVHRRTISDIRRGKCWSETV